MSCQNPKTQIQVVSLIKIDYTVTFCLLKSLYNESAAFPGVPSHNNDTMNSLNEANTSFAYDLFQQFRKSTKENIFYSPLSITSALAMTYLGSQNHTASEIQKVGVSFLYSD